MAVRVWTAGQGGFTQNRASPSFPDEKSGKVQSVQVMRTVQSSDEVLVPPMVGRDHEQTLTRPKKSKQTTAVPRLFDRQSEGWVNLTLLRARTPNSV